MIDSKILPALAEGRCPDCGGFIFRPGPRGGLSQNIECVGCGGRFNVAHWNGHLNPWPEPGLLIHAERIDNTGEWREDMFPKVLQ
jgi:hypothetical protein